MMDLLKKNVKIQIFKSSLLWHSKVIISWNWSTTLVKFIVKYYIFFKSDVILISCISISYKSQPFNSRKWLTCNFSL